MREIGEGERGGGEDIMLVFNKQKIGIISVSIAPSGIRKYIDS